MKLLLVNPKMASGWRPYVIPPIGLCSLKAAVEKTTLTEVKVLDASGMDLNEVSAVIEEYEPDTVGVTTFTEARHNALVVAKIAKDFGAVTLLGGVHATHTADQILTNYPFVDVIFRGEGEQSLVAFCGEERQVTASGVTGISYISRDKVKHKASSFISDLDQLPFPDYSDLDLNKYVDVDGPVKGRKLAAVETSRGCPYNCAFCSSKSVWGNIRFKSVERILKELEHLIDKYGYEMVSFVDDIFTIDKERIQRLCNDMHQSLSPIYWKCQTRTDCVDIFTLELMKIAGCRLIAFGVESGSPDVLEAINKKESPDDIRRAFELCKEVGIESVFNIIVGSPRETRETLKETRQLIKEVRPDNVATAALRAYPGSPVWDMGIKKGLFTDNILLSDVESIHYEGSMSISQMYRELIKFRILQAQLKGWKGWIELLVMGLKLVKETPVKVWKAMKWIE